MATHLRSDPELARHVARARTEAVDAGEILTAPTSFESPLDAEAGGIVASWIAYGGCERAIAVIEADEPDLRAE